jgi:flavin-binding protein dodecin
MTVAKIIELTAEGDSIEGAIREGVRQANKTLRHIREVYASDIKGIVEDDDIVRWRVNLKVTFIIEEE